MPREPSFKELADAVGVDVGEPEPEEAEGAEAQAPLQARVLAVLREQMQVRDVLPFRWLLDEFAADGLDLAALDRIVDQGVGEHLFQVDPYRTMVVRNGVPLPD